MKILSATGFILLGMTVGSLLSTAAAPTPAVAHGQAATVSYADTPPRVMGIASAYERTGEATSPV